jgi:Zn-dependent peptidase ImmA (M78 family)
LLVEDDTLAKPFELNRSKTDAKKTLQIRRKVMLLKLFTQKCISSKSYAKKITNVRHQKIYSIIKKIHPKM